MSSRPPSFLIAAVSAVLFPLLPLACGDSAPDSGQVPPGATTTGGGGNGGAGGIPSTGGAAPGNGGAGGVADPDPPDDILCPTTFTFRPPPGATEVLVPGEWNGFDLSSAPEMIETSTPGELAATLALPPGLHAYKLAYRSGGELVWALDPAAARRKYVGGVENSAVKVPDCRLPVLSVASSQATRITPGQGSFEAHLVYLDGIEGAGPDTSAFEATLQDQDGATRPLTDQELSVDPSGDVQIALEGLADGKHRVTVRAATRNGRAGEPLRLVFWVEAEPFSWEDALIYMVVTDRYRDGDPDLNAPPTPGADPRGDWAGGDLEGLRQGIEDGTLDALGVRAIWLTPFQENPAGAYLAGDGVHQVTGYHGYWPIKAREVDPRLGGAAALRALVAEAHRHGIRVLQDFVVNHVHEEHEYVASHPEWFRTGCVCGTDGCDWTSHALDCMFAGYLPDVDHTVPEANAAFVEDAMYWLDEFDLDGLRVDAVKHVEEIATRNLAAEVRETFEPAGTRYFLMGETAMGWNDCADPCNDENYGTIAKYIGPFGLDGQFDFVLYHGVSYRTFAWGDRGMLHAAYWTEHGQRRWPEGAIMTPYLGSHDTPRFATLADYLGNSPSRGRDVPGRQWTDVAEAPESPEVYARVRLATAWLLGLPGAPLLYYGDEYGEWGGADPNNRSLWRSEEELTADERETLDYVRSLGAARRRIPALRRGAYVNLAATEDTLVFGRRLDPGRSAVVALTRAGEAQEIEVEVAAALGLPSGTALTDALGGGSAAVSAAGTLSLRVPPGGALILAP
ncbi:glycosyl hydrolase [Sorangium cellulosum]|uniref:Glycosyl hydrolase n=1 Tax=Sorangium cellulosum TaxID=56 RepID=A0A2L0F505_SORCE|nr:alpha-amylase family glycosyl hydrolase [Sorangium cellulosum]AUX46650.1 glycosyl hydrolase [Sorangium cellulosum]